MQTQTDTKTQPQMPLALTSDADANTRTEALKRAFKYLKSADVDFAVKGFDGSYIIKGNLKVVEPAPKKERKRAPLTLPHGAIKDYLASKGLDAMVPGEVLRIDLEGIDISLERLRGSICARAHALWGKDSSITKTYANEGYVEILRLASDEE